MTEVDVTTFFFIFNFFSLCLLFLFALNSKLPQSLFTTQGQPLMLKCQTVSFKRPNASDPFVNIQIIAALILNSLTPFVSSQMVHKSVIHLEPNKLCWPQMVLASVFFWVIKSMWQLKLSVETIENKLIIMWSSFALK